MDLIKLNKLFEDLNFELMSKLHSNDKSTRQYIIHRIEKELITFYNGDYHIKCDEENNTPNIINQNLLMCKIYYQEHPINETKCINITFGIDIKIIRDDKISEILDL